MTSGLVKIRFLLDTDDWHGRPSETLWAKPVGNSVADSVYRLMNSPFFVRGVSFLDVVRAVPSADAPELEFAGVAAPGGHSTYMILAAPESKRFQHYWDKLAALGCTYESKTLTISLDARTLYSVDVPETADIHDVYLILDDGERQGVWMFQEGHVGHASARQAARGKT